MCAGGVRSRKPTFSSKIKLRSFRGRERGKEKRENIYILEGSISRAMQMEALPAAIGSPPGGGIESNFARWLEEGNELLSRLYHDWRGEELDEEAEDIHWKKVGDPTINEIGARKIVAFLRPLLSKNTFVSETTEPAAEKLKLKLCNQISKDLFIHSRRYEIQPDAIVHVTLSCYAFINFSINRALGGAEKELLGKTTSQHTVFNPDQPQGLGAGIKNAIGRRI